LQHVRPQKEPEQLRLLETGWRRSTSASSARSANACATEPGRRERSRNANDWEHFIAWCEGAGREVLPASAETLELYLTGSDPAASNQRRAIQHTPARSMS